MIQCSWISVIRTHCSDNGVMSVASSSRASHSKSKLSHVDAKIIKDGRGKRPFVPYRRIHLDLKFVTDEAGEESVPA
jgi:hypothetical protein